MKTIYHRTKIKGIKKLIVIALILIFIFFISQSDYLKSKFSNFFLTAAKPFWKISLVSKDWLNKNLSGFKEKALLAEQNERLKSKIQELEAKFINYSILEKENQDLKEALSRFQEKNQKYILANILARPPQTGFDVLIIDVGSLNGIQQGMRVIAYDDILFGYINEVFSKTSKVTLISSPSKENDVFIQTDRQDQIFTIAKGRGGGNLEIKLPVSIDIKEGNPILSVGTFPLVIGVVSKIEKNQADPFQKIFFRLPINIQQLRYVFIEK
ncbi:MAG: rod shape-determining protein MreC [Patescibacteria group bacterium]